MAVKTITIDLQAYELLSRHKRQGESFSKVIKRCLDAPPTGRDLQRVVAEVHFDPATLDAIDAVIAGRRDDPAGATDL